MPLSLIVAILSVALCIAGPLLAHFRVVPGMTGLALFGISALVGFVAFQLGLWTTFKKKNPRGWIAIALGAVTFLTVLLPAISNREAPNLNDVATDPRYPPRFQYARLIPENDGRDFSYGPEHAEAVALAYPNLQPLNVMVSPDEAFQLALETAKAQPGWTLTDADPETGVIEAIAETALFRFKEDVVIRISSEDGSTARIDLRSKSRDAKGDMGSNAKRIRSYLEDLASRLGS